MIVDSFAACFDFSLYIGIIRTSSVEIPVQCGGHVTLLRVFGPRGNTVDGSCLYISLHLNPFLCGSMFPRWFWLPRCTFMVQSKNDPFSTVDWEVSGM